MTHSTTDGTGARGLERVLRPFQEFAHTGALSGIALLTLTILALAWANSPWAEHYFALWETTLVIGTGSAQISKTLGHWINDGLMAVFFLLVGLEIKRELLVGELASLRQAALPLAAALGGMLVPAVIFAAINWGGPGAAGWGIPMATDIAFALGVLALLGPRVPVGLKVFLAAFAIADDLGAVLVIAVFYTANISWPALLGSIAIVAVLVSLNAFRVAALAPYLIVGIVLWFALLSSGLHATIAGVILALTIPAQTRINAAEYSAHARGLLDEFDRTETGDLLVITSKGQQDALHQLDVANEAVQGPLLRLEHALHATVSFVVMPLFAFANAGVRVEGVAGLIVDPVALGIVAGLVFGKPIGVALCSWGAIRFLGAALPTGVDMKMIRAVSWIAGIGFTMSLFVGSLAFGESAQSSAAKLGILAGSTFAGVLGYWRLRRAVRGA